MWYVYILECSSQTLYTGVTTDIERRFKQHQRKTARYTSYNPPVRIVYAERRTSRSAALRREASIKRLTRKEKLALINSGCSMLRFRALDVALQRTRSRSVQR